MNENTISLMTGKQLYLWGRENELSGIPISNVVVDTRSWTMISVKECPFTKCQQNSTPNTYVGLERLYSALLNKSRVSLVI